MKRLLFMLLVLIVAGCSGDDSATGKAVDDMNPGDSTNVAAVVNGEEIKVSEVDRIARQLSGQGKSVNRSYVVEQLVDRELLLQEAAKRDISVSESQAEQRLAQQLQGRSLEQLKTQLGEQYSVLIEQQKQQMMIHELAKAAGNVTVSEEELRTLYEQQKAMLGNATYEQVAPRLRQMLEQRKENRILSALLEELRTKADIQYS